MKDEWQGGIFIKDSDIKHSCMLADHCSVCQTEAMAIPGSPFASKYLMNLIRITQWLHIYICFAGHMNWPDAVRCWQSSACDKA